MAKCTRCSASLRDSDLFCPGCGTKIIKKKTAEAVTKAPAKEITLSDTLISYFEGAAGLELGLYGISQLQKSLISQHKEAVQQQRQLEYQIKTFNSRIAERVKQEKNYQTAPFKPTEIHKTAHFSLFRTMGFTKWLEVYMSVFLAFNAIALILFFVNGGQVVSPISQLIAIFDNAAIMMVAVPLILSIIGVAAVDAILRYRHKADYRKRKASNDKFQQERRRKHEQNEQNKKKTFLENSRRLKKEEQKKVKEFTDELFYLKKVRLTELADEISRGQNAYDKQIEALHKYYSVRIIYEKYQGLIPVSTMLDYLKSGRVNRLTGQNGAYNLFEQELRQNMIIQKPDDLISVNTALLNSQYALQRSVQGVLNEVSRVRKSVDHVSEENRKNAIEIESGVRKLQKSQDAIKYYASITSDNVEYLTHLETFRTYYDRYRDRL